MRVEIKFQVEVPDVGATDEQIEDWLRFVFCDNDSIDMENPLILDHGDPEPVFGIFDVEWNVMGGVEK
jgi:hypothetical protein